MEFSYKLFNPLYWHLREAMHNPNIRYIINRGGSSSGKSVSVAQAAAMAVAAGEGSVLVLRKIGATLRNTAIEEFKIQIHRLEMTPLFRIREYKIGCASGCKIDFTGIDDPEKLKSITGYRWIIIEEATELEYEDFTQIRFRLRGKPGLQIICNFNPVSEDSWIKKEIMDVQGWEEIPAHREGRIRNVRDGEVLPAVYSRITGARRNKGRMLADANTGEMEYYPPDTVEFHTTYRNNFWVVGAPDGKYGYYDRQTLANYQWYKEHDYNYYRVYALGEWGSIKTGGEFLYAFDSNTHIGDTPYIPGYSVHLSIDNNLLPYISVTFYQLVDGEVRQFHEICAGEPSNTVMRAAELVVDYLKQIGYRDVLFLYGDASTRSNSTMDEFKRSFLDKFTEGLEAYYPVEERIPKANPSVPMTGEFVNQILLGRIHGVSFRVDDQCKMSIEDYNNAKKDANGVMLKTKFRDKATGQTYERWGHLTDTLRYFLVQVFKEEYAKFSLRRKRSKLVDGILFFDIEKKGEGETVAMVLPDGNGYFVALLARVHTYIDVEEVICRESFSEASLMEIVERETEIVFECGKEFYHIPRTMRENGYNVRVLREVANVEARITAYRDLIREKVRFRSDYDTLPEYTVFMDSLMDYTGDRSEESGAANAVVSLVSFVMKRGTIRE